MSSIVVLVGNPQSASRTRLVAEEVARQLADRGGAVVEPTIDVADVAGSLFRFPDAEIDALLERVASADVLIEPASAGGQRHLGAEVQRQPLHRFTFRV